MLTEFKKYGFYELDYMSIPDAKLISQSNFHFSWGVSGSITRWQNEQSIINLSKESNSLVAVWHIKGTKQFNNSPSL